MNDPQSDLQARADVFRNVTLDAVEQARDLATRTAQQMDAGEFGIDAMTRSMSQFFDIVARGSATHFKTAIAGPCFSAGADAIPVAEEEVILEQAKDYPTKISIAKPFKDIARPDVVIPNYSVVLVPPLVVPANAKKFTLKVLLKDTQYIGRNYTAKLAFTEIGEPSLMRRDYQDVTVAL
jgi:hypothetical protein